MAQPSFTILSVTGNDSRVEFTLKNGSKVTQNVAGVPVDDLASAKQFLSDYALALQRGLDAQADTASSATPASGLLGVKFNV